MLETWSFMHDAEHPARCGGLMMQTLNLLVHFVLTLCTEGKCKNKNLS